MHILFLLIFIFHKKSDNIEIHDIIKPLFLKSGQTDTIVVSDLYFAENYDISFLPAAEFKLFYDKASLNLVLTPDSDFTGLTLLDFEFDSRIYSIPIIVSQMVSHTFQYQPENSVQKITVFGSFNSWNRDSHPMNDPDGDGIYECTISLDPGRYEYKFFIDGREVNDPANPDSVSNPFGSFNSVLTIPSSGDGNTYLHLIHHQTTGDSILITFYLETDKSAEALKEQDIVCLFNNFRFPEDGISMGNGYIQVAIEKSDGYQSGLLRLAVNHPGMPGWFQNIRFYLGLPGGLHESDFIWQDAIVYAIMVDRFLDGDPANTSPVDNPEVHPKANFQGGDLQGIIDKLNESYFNDLGVNVLWLSPVNQNTMKAYREYPPPHRYFTGYHGYWPVHHEEVDIRFGDINLFKSLVELAHENGIRVILDFVANHVHEEHPFYQEHPDWFGTFELPDSRQNIRLWDEYRLTTWFDTFLPSFDYLGSQEAMEIMTDNAVWWMKTSGIDGFRQDAVKHVPNDFWRLLTKKLSKHIEKEEQREIYQIGETFGSYDLISSYVNKGQLDAQFNFNLYDVALHAFLDSDGSFRILDEEMKKTFAVYGMDHLMGNLMDSHDKVRFMAYADGDILLSSPDAEEIGWTDPPRVDDPDSYRKARLYLTYMLSIPGVPVIYYGDEIGMTGAADPDNRRVMRFGNGLSSAEKEMLREVKNIIHIRRNNSALRRGDFLSVLAEKDIYTFIRSDVNERVLVILNKAADKKDIRIPIPEIYDVQQARDITNNQIIPVENTILNVPLDGISSRIMVLEK